MSWFPDRGPGTSLSGGLKAGPDKRPQTAVATTRERILEEMQTGVGQYEKLK
jgi:hypothetical protein